MSTFIKNSAVLSPDSRTSIVHRPFGGIAEVREVIDDASRLAVTALPMAMAKELVFAQSAVPACYILSADKQIYLGETSNVGRRLTDHASDPSKGWAKEVFVITGGGNASFDKSAAVYLQHRLTHAAEVAGLVRVQKGNGAQVIELPAWRTTTLNRIVEDGARMLFDAGCRAFHSVNSGLAECGTEIASASAKETYLAEDDGAMEIGIAATPTGTPEYQLAYSDIWARGYPAADGGFVVVAGSEVRSEINASTNAVLITRRQRLEAACALANITGLNDRRRLVASVWFPSWAIAAKVITGAHVSSTKWVPACSQTSLVRVRRQHDGVGAVRLQRRQHGAHGGRLTPPALFAIAVIALELGASAMILCRFYRWIGAIALAGFTVLATFLANRFWELQLPARMMSANSFFEYFGLA